MKKRVLALLLVGCFALTACGSKEETKETTAEDAVVAEDEETAEPAEPSEEEAADETAAIENPFEDLTEINGIQIVDDAMTADNCGDFITLGEYKGIKLEKVITEVTDADVDTQVASELASMPIENTDTAAVVKDGDTINLDYSGSIDGVAFDGGTAQGQSLEIGSGMFIPGFEEQMVGMHVGESGEIEVTFPEDYHSEDLAGKAAVFAVTVNSISEYAEEVTEEWLLANTSYTTEEDYRASVRENLETAAKTNAENSVKSEAWTTVFESAEFKQYPRTAVEESAQELMTMYEQYATMYGMEYEDFISQMGYTEDIMVSELENYVKMLLVMDYICYEEGYTKDSKAFQDKQTELLANSGFATVEDAVAMGITEWNIAATVKNALVNDCIYNNAVITEVPAAVEEAAE